MIEQALEQHGDRGGNDDRIQNAVLYAGFHPPPVPQTVVERQDRYDRIGNAESGEQRKLHDFIVDPETALQKIGSFFYSDRTENFRHAEHHHGEQSLHERGGYAYLVNAFDDFAVRLDRFDAVFQFFIGEIVKQHCGDQRNDLSDDRRPRRAFDAHFAWVDKNIIEHDIRHSALNLLDRGKMGFARSL